MKQFSNKRKRGFTLLELLVVIAITAILAGVSVMMIPMFSRGKELETERDKIVAYLRLSQSKAMTQEGGLQWGVRFDNTSSASPKYFLFKDSFYSATSSVETIFLQSNVQYTDPSAGNTKDTVFQKITGKIAATSTVTVALRNNPSKTKTVTVSPQGLIQSN